MGFNEKEKSRDRKRSVVSAIAGMGSSNEDEVPVQYEPQVKKGRPKEQRETKKRVSLAILPSIYENIGKIAYVDRQSISEVISNCLEEYIEKNQEKLDEYEKLMK